LNLQEGGPVANDVPIKKLILVPSVITLAITLLRLAGELMHWSPTFFNRNAGGGGALVGIAWLVPVFGIYFGLKLADAGQGPSGVGSALGYSALGFAVVPLLGFGAVRLGLPAQGFAAFGTFVALSILGAVIAYRGWPALGQTLLAYGFAARIPVAIVMFFAILGSWGTHYDVSPPNFPDMSPIAKWLLIGVLPQLTIWIWFTIAAGAIFGAIGVAATGRTRRPAAA
jgi:hypothetical protein